MVSTRKEFLESIVYDVLVYRFKILTSTLRLIDRQDTFFFATSSVFIGCSRDQIFIRIYDAL